MLFVRLVFIPGFWQLLWEFPQTSENRGHNRIHKIRNCLKSSSTYLSYTRHSCWPLGAHINSRDIRPIQLEKIRHEMKLWIVPSVSQRQNILTGTKLIPTGIIRPGLAGPGIKGRGRFKWMEERDENLWTVCLSYRGKNKSGVFIVGARLEKNHSVQAIIHGLNPIFKKYVLFICKKKLQVSVLKYKHCLSNDGGMMDGF